MICLRCLCIANLRFALLKIDAGESVSKLLLMELYEVDSETSDRFDHIADKGKVKRRIEILSR